MPPRPTLLAATCLLVALGLAGCGKPETQAVAKVRARAGAADAETARTELLNLVRSHPKSGEARLMLGQRLLDDGDGTAAAIELHIWR